MYKVSNQQSAEYGNVVVIEITEEGIATPFLAMQRALASRRLWKERGIKNIRFLIEDQIMTLKEMETWSHQQYQSLPKCPVCVKILDGDVYTHSACGTDIFCSQQCADQDYYDKMDRMKDECEVDYL